MVRPRFVLVKYMSYSLCNASLNRGTVFRVLIDIPEAPSPIYLLEATFFLHALRTILLFRCTFTAWSFVARTCIRVQEYEKKKAVETSRDLSYLCTLRRMSPSSLLFKLRQFTGECTQCIRIDMLPLAPSHALPLKRICIAGLTESSAARETLFEALFRSLFLHH